MCECVQSREHQQGCGQQNQESFHFVYRFNAKVRYDFGEILKQYFDLKSPGANAPGLFIVQRILVLIAFAIGGIGADIVIVSAVAFADCRRAGIEVEIIAGSSDIGCSDFAIEAFEQRILITYFC